MRTTELEKQLRQRPFVPFRLLMTDGKAFEIRHPEMLMVSRTVVAIGLLRENANQLEGIIFCDPVHIIRIEPALDGRRKSGEQDV